MTEVALGLELSLQVTLLHVVEGNHADVGLMAVLLPSSPNLIHYPRNLEAIGVALNYVVTKN